MKNCLKGLLFILLIISIIIVSCPTNSTDEEEKDKDKKKSSTSTTVTTITEPTTDNTDSTTDIIDTETQPTGTVTGTINDDTTVTIAQSDGTSQTTITTEQDPDFIFEDVPTGETTITIVNDQGQTTTQTIQVNEGETTQVNPFGSTQEMENSLTARVYEVDPILKWNGSLDWNTSTNNINLNKPLGFEFYSKEINVPERNFSEGFPGITSRYEYFGIIYEGQITAPATGTYIFRVTCDDGAELKIGETVLNLAPVDPNNPYSANKVHPTKTYQGTINLIAGEKYNFLLKYFQGPRYHITLIFENQIPGQEMKLFNSNDY